MSDSDPQPQCAERLATIGTVEIPVCLDYWTRKCTRARVELEHGAIPIWWYFGQYPQETRERVYPSGAICPLTMGMWARGPIEPDSAPEKAARGKIMWRSWNMENG